MSWFYSLLQRFAQPALLFIIAIGIRLFVTHIPSASEYENFGGPLQSSYDYIIVGGGAGGCALARLLSDNPAVSVLLIEAGGAEDGSASMPLPILFQIGGNSDRGYKTTPQLGAALLHNDKTLYLGQGKGLGGTTIMAWKMYVRGTRLEIDQWKDKYGCNEWSWDAMAPYFLKMENMLIPEFQQDHGKGGYVSVDYPNSETEIGKAWTKAGPELGYPQVDTDDYNLGNNSGFFRCQYMYKGQVLRSAALTFIEPIIKTRTNLKILLNSQVQRVLFDNNKTAIGVEYWDSKGMKATVSAKREVIISAGAIRTPQILHLSGVGPQAILKDIDVYPAAINEFVGTNLQDHVTALGVTAMIKKSKKNTLIDQFSLLSIYQYLRSQTGYYATPIGLEGLGFVHSTSPVEPDYPDTEIIHYSTSITDSFLRTAQMAFRSLGFTEQAIDNYWNAKGVDGRPSIFAFVVLLNAASRGRIVTKTKDSRDIPEIDYQYLSDPDGHDVRVLMDGLRTAEKVYKEAPAFSEYVEELIPSVVPGCEHVKNRTSDEYYECWARHFTSSSFHLVGSCPMGNQNSAVDCRLRVRGVSNLRVVDGSIFPVHVRGHPLAMIYATAFKAADMILADYNATISG